MNRNDKVIDFISRLRNYLFNNFIYFPLAVLGLSAACRLF